LVVSSTYINNSFNEGKNYTSTPFSKLETLAI